MVFLIPEILKFRRYFRLLVWLMKLCVHLVRFSILIRREGLLLNLDRDLFLNMLLLLFTEISIFAFIWIFIIFIFKTHISIVIDSLVLVLIFKIFTILRTKYLFKCFCYLIKSFGWFMPLFVSLVYWHIRQIFDSIQLRIISSHLQMYFIFFSHRRCQRIV